jgi:energy-coupling factor transport system ATP-binding protein
MLIEVKNASHIYREEQGYKALSNINLTISKHEFIGLVGHTGSGKSTLVQLLNGLIKPTSGQVIINGKEITRERVKLKDIRQKIGLVFQYPEHQLFEETIYDDVAFAPRNLGLSEEEVHQRVKEALELVDLDFVYFKDRSPFNLSGGQQRKVAIAGVLAMQPEVLILDEPSAGLDPRGREQLIDLLNYLYHQRQVMIILISHRMEEIAQLSSRVLVMNQGNLILDGNPEQVFSQVELLRKIALDLPEITEILWRLRYKGLDVRTNIFTISEAVEEIQAGLRRTKRC